MKEKEKEILKLEMEVVNLKRQLSIASELNHKMFLLLQEQTEKTEQLERLINGDRK